MPSLSQEVKQKLSDLESGASKPSSAEIIAVVRSIMTSLEGEISPLDLKIHSELESLATYIQDTRAEISGLLPKDINQQFIPTATDELSAVVGATEEATQKIMDCAEGIDKIANTLEGPAQADLMNIVTQIFEACSFQDITGQRINKVVKTLQHIEQKIEELLKVMGDEKTDISRKPSAQQLIAEGRGDEINEKDHLLNGPQLPSNASSQEEIDKLLASFD